MRKHPLDPILLQIRGVQDGISEENTLELYFVVRVSKDPRSQIRYILSSIRLSCKVEGVIDVLWKFAGEKIFKGQQIVFGSVGVVELVAGICVETVPDSSW